MKVLAIDPGYDRLGVAIMEYQNGKEVILFSSCVETDKTTELSDRLFEIGKIVAELIQEHQPDTVAIETLFFNKNIKTAIGVAQARGIILYLAKQADCKLYEFGPQEIKMAVTGYGNSDKPAVFDMIKRLIPSVPQKALDDEYDAIAVGITCLAQFGRTK
ncbi:crossover junction endodeoxyribonuclease RuvC [Candidatus Kaiserbacteria bacterium CG_4_9_14_0_2_um_filter_41_32]|uniref:Crossover junction endodeoxyribonuclease RuvC n=1 Tax=Candidatus Kaiserbacteria bacterium CG_4_9_14_0_2_um_filter_41_32 TaxID=1974601 RepID=A0A2M8FEL5_9BACT|nr:MAG: crossover junction endodeoxyribonuclease RuvC [Candidatus Kaiserbacteria bacterium CG_4_9_14_0_2_um_filter_41_32]